MRDFCSFFYSSQMMRYGVKINAFEYVVVILFVYSVWSHSEVTVYTSSVQTIELPFFSSFSLSLSIFLILAMIHCWKMSRLVGWFVCLFYIVKPEPNSAVSSGGEMKCWAVIAFSGAWQLLFFFFIRIRGNKFCLKVIVYSELRGLKLQTLVHLHSTHSKHHC